MVVRSTAQSYLATLMESKDGVFLLGNLNGSREGFVRICVFAGKAIDRESRYLECRYKLSCTMFLANFKGDFVMIWSIPDRTY